MNDYSTVIATVISGVLVYLCGEILKEIWIEPLRKYKEIKSRIAFALVYYAHYYANVIDLATAPESQINLYKEASDVMRKLASELYGVGELKFLISFGIPDSETLYEASKCLIGISNALFTPYGVREYVGQGLENTKRAQMIRKMLGMNDGDIEK